MTYLPPRRCRNAALFFGILFLAALVPALALGQEPAVIGDDPGELMRFAISALSASGVVRWIALALVAVLAVVWGVRRLAKGRTGKAWVWIGSDEGGTVLGWVVSVLGSVAAHVLAGGSLSLTSVGAVALGLKAGSALTWTDSRRILRVLAPLVRYVPKVGPALASLLDAISGANAKAEIAAATAAAYKPLDPAPDAAAAAAILSKPPVP